MLVPRLSNRGIPFNHYDYLQSFKILPYRRLDLFQIRASVRLKVVLRTYVGGLSETRHALVTMMDMELTSFRNLVYLENNYIYT